MLKTLFLNPPSFEGFDGGAGARYQARREIRSFWFPTWLAHPAAMIEGSKLVDAPPAGLTLDDVLPMAADYELAILHTSTPSFWSDVRTAEALKDSHPGLVIGFVGSHVTVLPEAALEASKGIDFVARGEFDYTIKEVAEGRPFEEIDGLSYRESGRIVHTKDRPVPVDMDALPHVTDVYKRDLRIEDYQVGEALYPYLSFYTGRGCFSRCTFCLWPQTIEGHRFRVRSPEHVAAEVRKGLDYFPQLKEFFFDDDTLTDNVPHVEGLSRLISPMLAERRLTWSCNAKGNVPYETLRVLKENRLRLVTVGFESGVQAILNNVRKGMKITRYRRFAEDCHKLGVKIHGAFILGLPGETKETIRETMRFAKEIDPYTIQVSVPAPYPGTFLYDQARKEGWLRDEGGQMLMGDGFQVTSISYPHLSHEEIFEAVDEFYRKFFFRPRKIAGMLGEMLSSPTAMKRRLGEARDFLGFLRSRENRPSQQ
ncbi:MAG: hopanoid biosynthesis associated radical SAM protein HpnJ [Deltaproteobacteria bacterium]|nr:hopanoid biosynthesis associated radical SAM protein HpnJ [Deltaproteobacteria bacterium]